MNRETKPTKGSILEKPIEPDVIESPDYTEEERNYISNLQKRLESAKLTRDQGHEEFDGMSFIEYYWANERFANTMLTARKNKGDSSFQSGTLRTKMMAFLSTFLGLNLKPDIAAFNNSQVLLNSLGDALEDVIDKTEELEGDEELKMLRQYELLKQGVVFVEDVWQEEQVIAKDLRGEFTGQKNITWSVKKEKEKGAPKRSIIPATSVYLGDLTKYDSSKQPYLFTVEVKNRRETKAIYGEWEMWDCVSKAKKSFSSTSDQAMVQNAWRLLGVEDKERCEIIKYQDKSNNEFQIIINGVPMLPLGFPLTAVSPDGEYTIVQQNLEPIRFNFAYGKSFIFKNKNIVQLLDIMMRLAVLKTQKSFLPPYLNLSDRVVSRDVFMPGQVSRGFKPGDLQPISEKETTGVTGPEFSMIQEVIGFIDRNTVSPTVTGSREGGQVTATQIIQLQRQARIMMGLLTLGATLLEKKLATKRLMILLKKWFEPVDEKVDTIRNVLKNRYRITSRRRPIEGEGEGLRMVMPVEEVPEPEEIKATEDMLKERLGIPIRMLMLNTKELKNAKLEWVITVTAKEKRSSEYSKLLFDEMITRLMNLVQLGLPMLPSPDWAKERFAQVWEEDSSKMFGKGGGAPGGLGMPGAPAGPEGAITPGAPAKRATPQLKMPVREGEM